jgi:general secretion pathway protein G
LLGFGLAVSVAWLLLTVVTLVVYFYRAWRRLGAAQNKFSHSVWLLFEMACAIILAGVVAWLFVPKYVTSPWQARERILRQDLFTMRTIFDHYTLDNKKSPHSLKDLVLSGYLKKAPTDPMTGRNDTWLVKCSTDNRNPESLTSRADTARPQYRLPAVTDRMGSTNEKSRWHKFTLSFRPFGEQKARSCDNAGLAS